jgi:serine phosphatase RsbU (regulator of sigma subunit)/Tfp pilus assembly protein PilF
MKNRILVNILFAILFPVINFSQVLVDNLYTQLSNCNNDSCKIRINNSIVNELLFIDMDEAERIITQLNSSVSVNNVSEYLETKYNYAQVLFMKDKIEDALVIYLDIEKNSQSSNNKKYLGKSKLGLAKCFVRKNDLRSAINLAFEALRIFEQLKDFDHISQSYAQIGLVNYKLKNVAKAIDYYKKSLEFGMQSKTENNIAFAYNNLGIIYSDDWKTNDIALEYYKRALTIRKQRIHKLAIAPILSNMGIIYKEKKQYDLAKKYYLEAVELSIQNKKSKDACICYTNIGNIYFELNDYKQADYNYRQALKYMDDDFLIKEMLYYNLGEVNLKLGNLKEALLYNDTCMTIKDSLYSREAIKSLNDMQVKYETEKTKLELEKKDLESKNKQIAIYAALGGILLLLGLVFFVFRGYKNKEKTNLALEEKNKIITEKSKIVEEQHKDITDSIKYAERIQTAILPPEKLWREILPQSFVFYNPKDILSGDFFWIEETKTHIFLAAADCTGHGVPGALVSIINYNLLNKAVLEKGLTDPAKILDQVNIWLTQALHQSYNGSHVRDGMDVAICAINKTTKMMQFAGAFNGGYLIKDGTITELVADKKPVGAFIEDDITSFTMKGYQLTGNESIYLFSDGYADQFGGPKGKKFKYKNLQNLLLSVQSLDFSEQQKRIRTNFIEWKGTYEQTDDVLVIGFKFS